MTTKDSLDQLLQDLPEDRLHQVVDFARFLNWQAECEAWQEFGKAQLAKAYGSDEAEYTEADVKAEPMSPSLRG
jgi:hypothetical protein